MLRQATIGGLILMATLEAEAGKLPRATEVVARTIFAESRGEGFTGMQAVATVIVNRAKLKKMAVDQVCLAPKQFSCWNKNPTGNLTLSEKRLVNDPMWISSVMIAQDVVLGRFKPMDTWTHYYSTIEYTGFDKPTWAKELANVDYVGNHVFGTLRG